MTGNVFSINYQTSKKLNGITRYAGLVPSLELIEQSQLLPSLQRHLHVRTDTQGWSDAQCIIALILLNLIGGNCISDINRLQDDPGLCRILLELEHHAWREAARTDKTTRWRKTKQRQIPSTTAIYEILKGFNQPGDDKKVPAGKAICRQRSNKIMALQYVLKDLLAFMQLLHPQPVATLDQDATLVQANKSTSQCCYKGFKSYQPLNTYWFEQGALIHSELRDGNVNAGFDELRVFKEALQQLPDTVKKVYLRTDGAGYQKELLRYCAQGDDPRFGVIEFAISAHVSAGLKQATREIPDNAWQPLHSVDKEGNPHDTVQQWAECPYVPEWISHKKSNPDYRYLVIRSPLSEVNPQKKATLPFPVIEYNNTPYKLHAIVTNRLKMAGEAVIHWHRQRCGNSEQVHKFQKIDLACVHRKRSMNPVLCS